MLSQSGNPCSLSISSVSMSLCLTGVKPHPGTRRAWIWDSLHLWGSVSPPGEDQETRECGGDSITYDVLSILTSCIKNVWMHAHSAVSDSLWLHDCSLPGSFLHGTLQAGTLVWVAISSSRGSSRPRDRTQAFCSSCTGRRVLYHWAIWEAQTNNASKLLK